MISLFKRKYKVIGEYVSVVGWCVDDSGDILAEILYTQLLFKERQPLRSGIPKINKKTIWTSNINLVDLIRSDEPQSVKLEAMRPVL